MDITYLSASSAKEFYKSPAHYLRYKAGKKEPTPAMEWGTAVHKIILEPATFDNHYHVIDEGDILGKLTANSNPRATKVYKDWLKEQQELAGDKKILNRGEYITLERVRDCVLQSPQCKGIFEGTEKEVPLEGEIWGVKFRGFADIIGDGWVADLKTTQSAHPKEFQRDSYNLMYHLQAAVYCQLTGTDSFKWVAVEANSMPIVQVYQIDYEYLVMGRKLLSEICERFKQWSGEVEGYANTPMILTPPSWAK